MASSSRSGSSRARAGLDVWEMDSRRFGAAYASREYTLARTTGSTPPTTTSSIPGTSGDDRRLRVSPTYGRLQGSAPRSGEVGVGARQLVQAQRGRRRRVAAAAQRAGKLWSLRSAPSTAPACGRSPLRTRRRSRRSRSPGRRRRLPRPARARSRATSARSPAADAQFQRWDQVRLHGRGRRGAVRIVTGTAFGRHDLAWIASHAPDDGSVAVEDVTSRYACIGLWGPRRGRSCSRSSSSRSTSPALSSRARGRAGSLPRAPRHLRRELGWELCCPMGSNSPPLGRALGCRPPAGLVAGGYKAIDSLRLEKAIGSGARTSRPRTRRSRRPGSTSRSARQGRVRRA